MVYRVQCTCTCTIVIRQNLITDQVVFTQNNHTSQYSAVLEYHNKVIIYCTLGNLQELSIIFNLCTCMFYKKINTTQMNTCTCTVHVHICISVYVYVHVYKHSQKYVSIVVQLQPKVCTLNLNDTLWWGHLHSVKMRDVSSYTWTSCPTLCWPLTARYGHAYVGDS